MAGRLLTQMSLDPTLVDQLRSHQLTSARDVLVLSLLDLVEILGITWTEAEALRTTISAHVAPPFRTAWQLHQERLAHGAPSYLLTTLPALDAALRTGLPAGSVTELVGPAGVGKSQLCFMLALLAALPKECNGLEGAVVYIDTESKFSSHRLLEIARARCAGALSVDALKSTMSAIMLFAPTTTERLMHCLHGLASLVLERPVRLVVVDGIAAVARAEFSGGRVDIVDRQEVLGQAASLLKTLAESLRVPILVTNQVTSRITTGAAATHAFQQHQHQHQRDTAAAAYSDGQLSAALGTKWAHCVNVRLILERQGDRRFLQVAKSPTSAPVAIEYQVNSRGVEQVGGPQDVSNPLGSVINIGIMDHRRG